tara:strand:+ start:54127 stop:54912 length:786 start_codon:yes stop_codon:yes gene_type:complete
VTSADSETHLPEQTESEDVGPVSVTESRVSQTGTWLRLATFLLLVGIISLAYFNFRDVLTLKYLATQETNWRLFSEQHPIAIYLIAFLIYTSITGLSLPGAVPLTLTYGWFFGFWKGLLLVSFSSTAGATLAFLMSRYLFRSAIQSRYGERFAVINQQFEKEGAFYLFILRLVPAFPFFLINVLMGLTTIRAWTFWWVSQIGMLAGTAVFIYAGTSVPTLQELSEQGAKGILTPQLIIAFILLGTFPLLIKKIVNRIQSRS